MIKSNWLFRVSRRTSDSCHHKESINLTNTSLLCRHRAQVSTLQGLYTLNWQLSLIGLFYLIKIILKIQKIYFQISRCQLQSKTEQRRDPTQDLATNKERDCLTYRSESNSRACLSTSLNSSMANNPTSPSTLTMKSLSFLRMID